MSEIKNFNEMLLKTFDNITRTQYADKDNTFNAWKYTVTSIKKPGSNECIGEKLFCHSEIIELKNGILLIETDHPAFIQMFRLYENYILRGLQSKIKNLEINSLAFRLKGSQAVIHERNEKAANPDVEKMKNRFEKEEAVIQNMYKDSEKTSETKEIPDELKQKFENMFKSLQNK